MKLANAIKTLEKEGYKISASKGSYQAEKEGVFISFFENVIGSGETGKFTYDSTNACAPTYGLTLKAAMFN